MTDDPLKHTPACELDRDNRGVKAMSDLGALQDANEENDKLRAEIKWLRADIARKSEQLEKLFGVTFEHERLQQRIITLEGLLGEANIAIPE